MARRAQGSFQRFWNASVNCCFDVIDGPQGNDASLRPNQIFAVSLPVSPLEPKQQRAVVDSCARHLLTSHGLRSLAPGTPDYCGGCLGPQRERDAAYHQGTDRKSTRLNSSHVAISYAVFCLKKKKNNHTISLPTHPQFSISRYPIFST